MPDSPNALPVAMINSTALDLPEHREEVMKACQRQSMFPKMQESQPTAGSCGRAECVGGD